MEDFLGPERNQHSGALGGQGPQGLDSPQTIGESRIQAILLLPAQNAHLAQVLPGCREQCFRIAVQLFFGIRQMDHGNQAEHHPLIPVRQIVHHFLGFFSLLLYIIGQDSGEVVGGILLPLPIGGVCFHPQQLILHLSNRLVSRYRENVNRKHEAPVQIAELRYHGVLQVAGVTLQVERPAPAAV